MTSYDAVLLVSFGGPEGLDDVMPFLRNVTRGRNIPDERLRSVAHHYEMFGGISPINEQNRQLIAALRSELDANQIDLPIYWGNRNWHPMLGDTVRQMRDDGVKRALAFVTSAYSSYSGCRQYREDIERARAEVDGAPEIDKIKVFFDEQGFLEANESRLRDALNEIAADSRSDVHVAFTAHSIPISMADGCQYFNQLTTVARTLAEHVGASDWNLVFQSRSGPPSQPWLEPDINDHLRGLHKRGVENVVVAPIGFVSDHMEIVYDLDTEAAALAKELGLNMVRARTVGTHPAFVRMIRKLVQEAPSSELCSVSCCVYNPEPRSRSIHPAVVD